jgi:hypothetical protein
MTAALAPELELLRDTWDRIIDQFLAGGDPFDETTRPWFEAYRGRGEAVRQDDALPEPFHGRLDQPPRAVVLSINPGLAYLGAERWGDYLVQDLQSRKGLFAEGIRAAGSFTEWTREWRPWSEWNGGQSIPFVTSRVRFVEAWCAPEHVEKEEILWFELYPWHSSRWGGLTWTKRVVELVQQFILDPIEALGGPPVFAFGSPWFDVLEKLGLEPQLSIAGGDIGADVAPAHVVQVFKRQRPPGQEVIAMKHQGGAGPPKPSSVPAIRTALGR